MVKRVVYIPILLMLCGCFGPKALKHPFPIDSSVVSGFVVDGAGFHQGGMLCVAAFKPGPSAAANEQTDQLSLMLVKGIKESLHQQKTAFAIKPQEDASKCEASLQGYIEGFTKDGLAVDGEIWSEATGAKIFVFQGEGLFRSKKEDPMGVALRLGARIGDYIASQVTKE